MRISDWSSDVCSSDLGGKHCDGAAIQSIERTINAAMGQKRVGSGNSPGRVKQALGLGGRLRNKAADERDADFRNGLCGKPPRGPPARARLDGDGNRSEEHTSELQSLMRTTYAVF